MRNIISFLLLILAINTNAQFANNWYMGNGYGINFNTSTPSLLAGSISGHPDNSSSISDASGNLLFYTTGVTVWNKFHTPMPNGTGLLGSYTGGQCALIVPIPCNPNKYVIFHTTLFSSPGYLYYSVVDMSLNGGLGDVVSTQKNISLGTGWTEKMCAYYNPAGNNYWLLSHKWMSDQYVAFKVDATSIATSSVVSAIGSVLNCGSYGGVHDAMGQLTISPDGSKVVNALTCQDKYELFDFNINTGVVSNSISISGNGGNAWGTAFSSDSKKIYTDVIFGGAVYQYDITTYNAPAVNASKTQVFSGSSSGYIFGYAELAPNGKIYIPQPGTNFMAVINSPNSLGAACSFSYNGFSIGSAVAQHGTSRIAYNIPTSTSTISPSFSLSTVSSSATCNGMANGSATVTPSPAGSYSYLWSPGNYTTSTINNLTAGNYTVTVSNGSCSNTVTTLNIIQPTPLTAYVDPLQICAGNSGPLNANAFGGTPAYSYSWSTGAITNGILVGPPVSTNYTLYVTDANGCTGSTVTTVTVTVCTGINEHIIENGIALYPNPCSGILHYSSDKAIDVIKIYDLLGKEVEIHKNNIRENTINIGNLNEGVYVIRFYHEGKTVSVKKFVKQD